MRCLPAMMPSSDWWPYCNRPGPGWTAEVPPSQVTPYQSRPTSHALPVTPYPSLRFDARRLEDLGGFGDFLVDELPEFRGAHGHRLVAERGELVPGSGVRHRGLEVLCDLVHERRGHARRPPQSEPQ